MRLLATLLTALAAATGILGKGPLRFRYWPGGEPLARYLADLSAGYTRLPGLPADILEQGGPIEVQLAPDRVLWDSLTGGVPDWGAGVAIPAERRIVLPAFTSLHVPVSELGVILRHELAHVALHRYLADAPIPRWFDEGYATWASGGMDWQSIWMLRLAFLMHRAPPLDSLELEWPAGEAQARVAYLLSASAVALLAERTGERGLTRLLRDWRQTRDLDLALRRAFGITLGQFEREWRDEVKHRYGWTVFFSNTLVFWLLLSPLLVFFVLVRRRRDRERLARLRSSEPPDLPDWWNEPGPDQPGGAPGAPPTGPNVPDGPDRPDGGARDAPGGATP